MNIFYLHKDPVICAQMHCDKHVVKMNIEYAQLLSTAHRVIDGTMWIGKTANGRSIKRYFLKNGEMNSVLYKASHINHPSAIWVRDSIKNYQWLYDMWIALGDEYTYRYGKVHESIRKLSDYLLFPPTDMFDGPFTQPIPAMQHYPQCIVEKNSIASYRNYYWIAKQDIAKWKKRETPQWWNEFITREKDQTMGVIGQDYGLILE